MFRRLEELQSRQEACEARVQDNVARLDVEERHHAEVEQVVKDAIGLVLALQDADRPVTADGASGDWAPVSPGRPKLRVILGGLAVAATAALVPAGAAAAAHHHPAHHVTAAHSRRARDADPAGERIDG